MPGSGGTRAEAATASTLRIDGRRVIQSRGVYLRRGSILVVACLNIRHEREA